MNDLANIYHDIGKIEKSIELLQEVIRIRSRVPGDELRLTLFAKHDLAVSYDHIGRRDEALLLFEEVVEGMNKTPGFQPRTIQLATQRRDSLRLKIRGP